MAFPSLGLNLLSSPIRMAAVGFLYASSIVWIVILDTIYRAQDRKEDQKAAVYSMAVRHEKHTKFLLIALGILQVFLLAIIGIVMKAGPAFFSSSCGGAIVILSIMIHSVDLKDPSNCLWWFQNGGVASATVIASGFLTEYGIRLIS
ncbi:Para-hydroxybenzoate--polyprenyltransferase, mitochondrial precursor (PHB:polyprenyltransferase) [Pseudocyphellaria aurata]|nr:Para-hydroxybenzoate--polyprenyltransferase, mitochondrial precursor (PHB:polyprenyltransferase) [Pseudocyphellaria aurata]